MLTQGDSAPWFLAPNNVQAQGSLSNRAGQYVVLSFLGSAALPASKRLLEQVEQQHHCLQKSGIVFCGVSSDREDERPGRIPLRWPGAVCFWDVDLEISRLYGAIAPGGNQQLTHTLILDPSLRVLRVLPFEQSDINHFDQILRTIEQFPPLLAIKAFAPILILPFVFEPELCAALINLYETSGGVEGGTMRDIGGKSVKVHDHSFKSRKDCVIRDPELLKAVDYRLQCRIFPEIHKAFQFMPTQVERYIVSCYDAQAGGHFKPHRDDTGKGSAHRRFAISINLNSEQYEGGGLIFREYGYGAYRAPTGAALIFSCSLMHEVRPITKGRRFAFLPFVYDDVAAKIRDANREFVDASLL